MITPGTWANGSIHHNFAWNLYGGGVDPYKDNTFIYQDSFSAKNVTLFANIGLNICQGIYIAVGDPNLAFDRWRIHGNRLTINSTGNGMGITQGAEARFSRWKIYGNYVSSLSGHALFLSSGTGYTVSGNTFEGLTRTADATIAVWKNNRRPDGALIRQPSD